MATHTRTRTHTHTHTHTHTRTRTHTHTHTLLLQCFVNGTSSSTKGSKSCLCVIMYCTVSCLRCRWPRECPSSWSPRARNKQFLWENMRNRSSTPSHTLYDCHLGPPHIPVSRHLSQLEPQSLKLVGEADKLLSIISWRSVLLVFGQSPPGRPLISLPL